MADEALSYQVRQDDIAPFWHKMAFFFLYPFRFGPLITILCITGASALAGLAMGTLGMVFKGMLIYAGLRYAFNVLDLFSQGKFEGESAEFSFSGRERRPAKFGLVVALFIVIGSSLGGYAVVNRVMTDRHLQDRFVQQLKDTRAAEAAREEQEEAAQNRRLGLDAPATGAPAQNSADTQDDEDAQADAGASPDLSAPPVQAQPATHAEPEVDVAEAISLYMPRPGQPAWFKLLPAWFWAVMILLSLMLPAALIVIAMEDKFFKALNPAHVIYLFKSMGSAYFVLWAFFLVLVGSRLLALSAGASLPAYARLPLETALSTYLGIALCAMVGYVLYQYHQELGLEVTVDFDTHREAGGTDNIARTGTAAALRQKLSDDPLERKIQPLLAEGKVREAIEEIKDFMRYDKLNPELNTRLHPLYVQLGDAQATATHGQQWINALVRAERNAEACSAIQRLSAVVPDFTIENSDALLPIATVAIERREYKLAFQLIRGFDKRFPKHKDTAAIFFLGARLTSEYLRKHEEAMKILRTVLRVFPDHPVIPEARTYLGVLEKVTAQA